MWNKYIGEGTGERERSIGIAPPAENRRVALSHPGPCEQADNAGFDATDILNRLRQKHAREGDDAGKWFGVDVDTEGVGSTVFVDILWFLGYYGVVLTTWCKEIRWPT